MEKYLHDKLYPLYKNYNETIKPLIGAIEVYYEKFPIQIFNEIRSYNDHVSRCYANPLCRDIIDFEISKAKSHIDRIILDCYKFLNVALHRKTIERFDKISKHVDLSVIDNGEFSMKYYKLRRTLVADIKKAKLTERTDKDSAFKLYETSYLKYSELEEFLEQNTKSIYWATAKHSMWRFWKFSLFLISAVISGFISTLVPQVFEFLEKIRLMLGIG